MTAPEAREPQPDAEGWDYETHPGDCHPRREGDVWTVCCRGCAGTGVFPAPWINSPSEGRANLERNGCVACKNTGRAAVYLTEPDETPRHGSAAGMDEL